jgi:IS5 family transposase
MLKSSKKEPQQSLFFSLEDSLNQKHPLYIVANKVDWDMLESSFRPLYCEDNGTQAKQTQKTLSTWNIFVC